MNASKVIPQITAAHLMLFGCVKSIIKKSIGQCHWPINFEVKP